MWKIAFFVLLVIGTIIGGVWLSGIAEGGLPDWFLLAVLTAIVVLPYALIISAIAVSLLFDPYRVVLHELEPENGDVSVHYLSQDRFEEMVVTDANGKEIGQEYLHGVSMSVDARGYEVTQYNPSTNVAEVSWMGEKSNAEIRRHEELTGQLKETLSPLARSYRDMHAKLDIVIERKVSDSMNSLLAMVEGIELPPGQEIHNQMSAEMGERELEQLPDPEEELDEIETAPYDDEPAEPPAGGNQ